MVFVWYDYCFASKDLTGMSVSRIVCRQGMGRVEKMMQHGKTSILGCFVGVRPGNSFYLLTPTPPWVGTWGALVVKMSKVREIS